MNVRNECKRNIYCGLRVTRRSLCVSLDQGACRAAIDARAGPVPRAQAQRECQACAEARPRQGAQRGKNGMGAGAQARPPSCVLQRTPLPWPAGPAPKSRFTRAARPPSRAPRAAAPLPPRAQQARVGAIRGPGPWSLDTVAGSTRPYAAPRPLPGPLDSPLSSSALAPRCLPYILVAVRKDTRWFVVGAVRGNDPRTTFPERGTVGDADEEGRAQQPAR